MFSANRVRVLLACGSIAMAPLMHAALVNNWFVIPAIGAAASQASLAAWLAASRWQTTRWRWARHAASITAGAAVLAVSAVAASWSIATLSGLAHAALHLTLLTLFAGSLRPGRTPAVTVVARAARGPLPPELVRYTRAVTWLWAGFAAAQLAASVLLLAFAPRHVWSLFVNGLDFPSVLLLFGAEYAFRRYRYRALPRLSPSQLRRAVAASVLVRGP